MRSLIGTFAMMTLAASFPAAAFDLEAFSAALSIRVTTLELDVVLVVHHDEWLNSDIARGPDGTFLSQCGPAIYSMTLQELKLYDLGRLKPESAYAARLPEPKRRDGARIPTLAEIFELVSRAGADRVKAFQNGRSANEHLSLPRSTK